mmetsp:Transcript_47564/g.122885  ORF Transcript_47564/g.122885 Transcript_47564/m.122885 type:complete len:249 (-) Transcript_47564:304-1050(-)
MEACARRRLPQAAAFQGPGRGNWLRHAAADLRRRDPHLLRRRLPVPRAPRLYPPGYVAALHVRRHPGGLHVGPLLQDVEGRGLEEDDADDGVPVSRHCLRDLLLLESVHLGSQVFRGSALHHDVRPPRPLVRHLGAARVPGGVLRVQEGSDLAASAHEPDPAPDPRAAVVHQRGLLVPRGRHPPVRCRLHGAVLHHVLHVAASVLLPVRFPRTGLGDPSRDVCRDCHRADLLPADSGGLQVVVALLLC